MTREDRAFDLAFILGVPALACAMGLAVAFDSALFLPLLAVHTWCFSFDHVISTFTRLVGAPEDRRRYRFLVYALPPLVFAALFVASRAVGVVGLATFYFLFQWFHTTRQSWGIAQHYRRMAGGLAQDPVWLSELTLWGLPIAGLLHRCQQQPTSFLFMDLRLPPVPESVVTAAVVVSVALVLFFFARRRAVGSRPHTLYFSSHFLVFALAYLVIDDLHAGWLLVNVWHNVQYLVFVWRKNRERFAARADTPILAWLCQPGRARGAAYFAACLAVSTPIFAVLYALTDRVDLWLVGSEIVSITLLVAFTINFHHYVVDAIIWRRPQTRAASTNAS